MAIAATRTRFSCGTLASGVVLGAVGVVSLARRPPQGAAGRQRITCPLSDRVGPRTRTRHAETQIRGLAPVASPFEEGRAVGAPAEPSPFPSQPCESARGGERFVTGGGGGVSAAARAQCCVRDGVYMVARARRRVRAVRAQPRV